MEEGQYMLHKPLAFYPFTNSDHLLTAPSLWAMKTENSDLNYSVPFYMNVSEQFPVSKQCGAFEQPGFDTTRNLTHFVTSVTLEDYYRMITQGRLYWNVPELFSTISNGSNKPIVNRSCLSESNPLIMYSNEHSIETSEACNDEKASKIWRPFSPELDCGPSSNFDENQNSFGDKTETTPQVSACRLFPTILPSSVKLGESSVFKAVKKKRYQCQYCDQWYLNSGQLAGHIRAHIGSKPYRCEYHGCSRAFARNEELTRHRRIHSGVKPHQCDTCQKRFGRKDHLNKHKKTHMKASEKKIYLCEVPGCKHRYTRSDALTRHLSTAHSIRHQRFNSGRNAQSLLLLPDAKNNEMTTGNGSG